MHSSIYQGVVRQRCKGLPSSLMKRKKIPWRKAYHLGSYPTIKPVLWVLLLTVIMPMVGHCHSLSEPPDDDLIYLVPPLNLTGKENTVGWVWTIDPDGSTSTLSAPFQPDHTLTHDVIEQWSEVPSVKIYRPAEPQETDKEEQLI